MKVTCNSCGKEIDEEDAYSIRREWRRRGYHFCDECVTSKKARKWAEEHDE